MDQRRKFKDKRRQSAVLFFKPSYNIVTFDKRRKLSKNPGDDIICSGDIFYIIMLHSLSLFIFHDKRVAKINFKFSRSSKRSGSFTLKILMKVNYPKKMNKIKVCNFHCTVYYTLYNIQCIYFAYTAIRLSGKRVSKRNSRHDRIRKSARFIYI